MISISSESEGEGEDDPQDPMDMSLSDLEVATINNLPDPVEQSRAVGFS